MSNETALAGLVGAVTLLILILIPIGLSNLVPVENVQPWHGPVNSAPAQQAPDGNS